MSPGAIRRYRSYLFDDDQLAHSLDQIGCMNSLCRTRKVLEEFPKDVDGMSKQEIRVHEKLLRTWLRKLKLCGS